MDLIAKRDTEQRGGGLERYHVWHGNLNVGIIDRHLAGPPMGRFTWSINFTHRPYSHMKGGAGTMEEAMAAFRARWQEWLEWAGLEAR